MKSNLLNSATEKKYELLLLWAAQEMGCETVMFSRLPILVICPEQLFQFDTLARMTATFCEGCSMIANYGGDSGRLQNPGQPGLFSTAALGEAMRSPG